MLKKKAIFILSLGIMLGVFMSTCGSVFAELDKGDVATDNESLPYEDLRTFTEIFGRIKRDYVEPVSDKKLLEDAVRGMLSGLDPHSAYLVPEEYQELKSVFRKATKLCHPDLVDPDSQLQAQETFNEVKRLFENNDIENLKKVLTHLESGAFITNSSLRTENEFDKLKLELNRLRIKKESLIKELQEIKNSDSYKVVINVKDIEEYFGFLEKKLINEIKELKVENL